MKNPIHHEGTIESIDAAGHVRVQITQAAACAGCRLSGNCNASEAKVKFVDVYDCPDKGLRVGDAVTVSTSESSAGKALLLGFGLPLALLLLTLVVLLSAGVGDGLSALSAIAVLIPYYIYIWMCREKIARGITFQIENNIQNTN